MPTYTNQIPAPSSGPALPIRRTPPQTPLIAIVTSDDLIGTYTHYFKGRTQPCETPNCEPCQEGIPFRWHAYLSAWETKTALHFIFETTAAGAEPFTDYRDHHGTLRGCLFQAKRWLQRPNGRLLIQTKPVDLKEIRLPQPPDLIKCLAILWNLSDNHLAPDGYRPDRKMKAIAPDTRKPTKKES